MWREIKDVFQALKAPSRQHMPPNPHLNQKRSFFSGDVDRLLNGWATTSNSIDHYLRYDLAPLRARSRELIRRNPYAKRFVISVKSNIVGPAGVVIQSQTKRMVNGQMQLDTLANDAIEKAFKDWAKQCDITGKNKWIDLQNLAISSAAGDGCFIFETSNTGKYGFQLKILDSAKLDITKNELTKNGEIRLGVEYNSKGAPIWYHFKDNHEVASQTQQRTYKISARNIIHGFISEYADQSTGIPWMHASIERLKHLDKYDEAAMVAARYGASKALLLSSNAGDVYEGNEDGTGRYENDTLDHVEAGMVKDIGDRTPHDFDPKYPHEMYDQFVSSALRGFSAGVGTSYHSISNDLNGVNYSSIRAGVLEDREIYKGLQNWFIGAFIRPVFEQWIKNAVLSGNIRIGTRPLARPIDEYLEATYQSRRWAWVDPQKDSSANQMALENNLTTEGMLIEEQGGNPEDVWRRKKREQEFKESIGLKPEMAKPRPQEEEEDADEED